MRFHVKTYGCQMNVYDSDRLIDVLKKAGHKYVEDLEEGVDLLVVNTCAVREKPEERPFSFLTRFKNKARFFGFGGCVAQKLKEKVFEKAPFVNFIFGSYTIERIPEVLEKLERGEKGPFDLTGFEGSPASRHPPYPVHSNGIKAFVKIMEGCNNFCSYCVVPYVRGREFYRSSREIVEEVRCLLDMGVKEVMLIGQNVNSYRDPEKGMDFPDLLYELDKLGGEFWIRYTTSHPKDFGRRLVEAHRDLKKLCNHVHLPFQSGSNKILRLMNRGYTREEYIEKVDLLKKEVGDVAISADCIVGFPGESERDFLDTIDLLERVRFDLVYSFIYSKREGTKAASMEDDVPLDEKRRRLEHLLEVQGRISLERNKEEEGRVLDVLVEGFSKRDAGEVSGRTRKNKVVNFPGGDKLIGGFVKVKIKEGYRNSLKGVIE